MAVYLRFLTVLLVLSVLTAPSAAQDNAVPTGEASSVPAAESDAPPASAAEPGPARAEFDKLDAKWKSMLEQLRDLRQQYRDANPAAQLEIADRYARVVEEGESLESRWVAAALKAYEEAPFSDRELGRLISGFVTWSCGADNYAKAWDLIQVITRSGVDDPTLDAWAGMAAFALMQLDDAEKRLKRATDAGVLQQALSPLGEHWFASQMVPHHADLIPYYREAWPTEQEIRAAEAEADDLPRVLLKTNRGDILLELFENEAPNTVANFVSLVEKGFYDGTTFHRVLSGFMAQGGCPDGTGAGGPGYMIPCECYQANHRLHFRGSLSMAHAGPNTGGSQFFLTFVPTGSLDGRHTVFGRLIDGMEVLSEIQRRDPESEDPPDPDKIIKAKVVRKRDHPYVPKTVDE